MTDGTNETHAAIVKRGVDAFANLDDTLALALDTIVNDTAIAAATIDRASKQAVVILEVVNDGVAAGMVPELVGGMMIGRAVQLLEAVRDARIGDAIYIKYKLHAECVKAAKANNVDTGGVTRVVGLQVLGGGPR